MFKYIYIYFNIIYFIFEKRRLYDEITDNLPKLRESTSSIKTGLYEL